MLLPRLSCAIAVSSSMSEWQQTVLPNGLQVLTIGVDSASSLALGVWVAVGARDEAASENGYAHMMEHMAFKGTATRDAASIARMVEDVGGYMNAHTGLEETAYYLRMLPEDAACGMDILADILLNSSFPKEEISREKEVVIQEIYQANDTPDDLVFSLLQEACYGAHPFGRSILGTVENVKMMSREKLMGFMADHYLADRMLICAVGKLVHEEIVSMAAASFAGTSTAAAASTDKPSVVCPTSVCRGQPPVWLAGSCGRFSYRERQLEQMHVALGLPGPVTSDSKSEDDRYNMLAFAALYGGGMSSRLFQEIREKRGLCYSIFSHAQINSDNSMLAVYAGTNAGQASELVRISLELLASMADDITDADAARIRAQLRAGFIMSQESLSGRAERLARNMLLLGSVNTRAQVFAAIDRIDTASLRGFAGHLLQHKPVLAAVGPAPQDHLSQHLLENWG